MRGIIFWAVLVCVMLCDRVCFAQSASVTPGAPQQQPGGAPYPLYSFPGNGLYTLPNGFTLIAVEYEVKIMRGAAVDPVAISPWTPVTVDTTAKTHVPNVVKRSP
jgi:hypothetical protein